MISARHRLGRGAHELPASIYFVNRRITRSHARETLSGYPELNRGYMHPMHAYYHYTISRDQYINNKKLA